MNPHLEIRKDYLDYCMDGGTLPFGRWRLDVMECDQELVQAADTALSELREAVGRACDVANTWPLLSEKAEALALALTLALDMIDGYNGPTEGFG